MPESPQTEQIFLSYNHVDEHAAVTLRSQLEQAGFSVFRDADSIRLGDNWMQSLQNTIQACSAFIVLIGREGVQQKRWVGAEVEAALSRKLSPHDDRERLAIFPILLPDAATDDLPLFLKQIQSAVWQSDNAELPQGLLQALQSQQLHKTTQATLKGQPYRGLSYFRQQDQDRFFGRHNEVMQALHGLGYAEEERPELGTAVNQHSRYYRWLQIHSASGAGKSSLLRAGLLPKIEQGVLWRRTGYANWQIIEVMIPGEHPLDMLAEKLAKAFPEKDMDDWLDKLNNPNKPSALAHALRPLASKDTAILLVIDQFEELFTLANEQQRRQFDRLLATALQDPDCPLFVISTVRSDFLDRFTYLPELLSIYNTIKSDYLLPTITESGLRELITSPARLAGLQVDNALVEAIVRDARGEPGALPLVESALTELWSVAQSRGSQQLSKAYYEQHNGVAGMLAKQADALIASLGERGRKHALNLLLALTHINEGGRHTRRKILREDAIHEAGGGKQGEKVVQWLTGERQRQIGEQQAGPLRLIVTHRENTESGKPSYVELVHEMLVRASDRVNEKGQAIGYWPSLYHYIFEHRDRDVQRQQLQVDAQRWQARRNIGRWFGLASWRDLRVFKYLRPRAKSDSGRYLQRSRRMAWLRGALLLGFMGVFAESAWWANNKNLPFGYTFIKPLWAIGLYAPIPEMVKIPAGEFTMGCVEGRDDVNYDCRYDEKHIHKVTIAYDFQLAKTETTFLEYDYYVWSQQSKGKNIAFPSDVGWGRGQRPVINISWDDSIAYAQWLKEKTARNYRLPTEAEWEYAARAGKESAYSWGNALGWANANCNYDACKDTYDYTAPVGSFSENPFGLFDMHGNVWEWVQDTYGYSYDNTPSHVLRGGSWLNDGRDVRSAKRGSNRPDARTHIFGFRLAIGQSSLSLLKQKSSKASVTTQLLRAAEKYLESEEYMGSE